MRNPNGYGGVVKLSGKRRKPYCARVTDGWEELPNGKKRQKYKVIGYFKKQTEANDALSAYHNPTEIKAEDLTFDMVYQQWKARKFKPGENINVYNAAYNVCGDIKDMKMSDIKYNHLQDIIDKSGKNEHTLRKVKTIFLQVYDYALKNDIINKDYSKFVKVPTSEPQIERIPFSEEEIQTLWDNLEKYPWLDTVLIQIYTGMRITELLIIENKKVFLDKKYMIGGIKTEAGRDRDIPLHDRILPLVEKRFNAENNFLILDNGSALSYHAYRRDHWNDLMRELFMKHLPHDCRHTFKTRAKIFKLDDFWVNRIIGHKAKAAMDDIYAHNDIEAMLKEVNLLP